LRQLADRQAALRRVAPPVAGGALADPVTHGLRELGIRSVVASPIIVNGRLWGVMIVVSRRGPFPADTADRMADFTELAATAIQDRSNRALVDTSLLRVCPLL
jgi:GAF domain-containing protein